MARKSAGWLKFLFNESLYVVKDANRPTNTASEQGTADANAGDDEDSVPDPDPEHRRLMVALEGSPSSEDRQLLNNILKAINTDMSEVHLLELDGKSPVISQADLENMPHDTAILFGENIQHHLHRNARLYSSEHYDTYRIMQVDHLSTLRQFKLKKKALWQALQKLFDI